jgi:hypothetical protein
MIVGAFLHRRHHRPEDLPMSRLRRLAPLALILLALTVPAAEAAITVSSLASGTEDASITPLPIENFEDTTLLPGLSVTFSAWRTNANVLTANPPVTYTGTLPVVWNCAADGFPNNPWDGAHALVNGTGHDWAFPFASSIELTFSNAPTAVGFGLSNFQRDAGSAFTFHALTINGVSHGNLESLPGWTTNVFGHNRYILITGEPITSVKLAANTHFDGMVVDKLAFGDLSSPAAAASWGRLKGLYR